VTTRAATLAALLAVLGRPTWWLLALAGFLARGGILLFLLAIIVLPSPLAVSNLLAPLLVPIIFGGVTPALAAAIAATIVTVLALIAAGTLLGAVVEVELIEGARAAAGEEGIPLARRPAPGRWRIARVAVARAIAHIPLLVVASLAAIQIVSVVYVELISPVDITTPLPVRILVGAAAPTVAILVALVIGEIAGGWAARAIVLDARSVLRAVMAGFGDLVDRPASALLPALLTTGLLVLDLAAMLAAVDLAWTIARSRLVDIPPAPVETGLALASFAATWFLALLVTGLIDAWRSVAMTFEAERRAAAERPATVDAEDPAGTDGSGVGGTIGGSTGRRPGDWSAGSPGGSL